MGNLRSHGFVIACGGLAPIVVSILLVPLRDEIDNANLALVLVLVVVVAASLGGRLAGALAAVTSTIAFDFFLAAPYLSARVQSADDVETLVVLLAVGLLVGELASRARTARREQEAAAEAVQRVRRVADSVAQGEPLRAVLGAVERELVELLGLWQCWLELPPFLWVLPRLERGGTLEGGDLEWSANGFMLPRDGVELPVVARGAEVARLVLLAGPDTPASLDRRVVAVALADQLGAAMSVASPDEVAALPVGPDR
jgi:Domain of unknown function (DUF4118)